MAQETAKTPQVSLPEPFTIPADEEDVSFSERHQGIYILQMFLFSLPGYGYLLSFPFLSLLFGWLGWQQLQHMHSYLDYVLFASESIAMIITCRLSYHLFTLEFPFPDGIYLPANNAAYLHELINEIQLENHTPIIHRLYISKGYEAKIIRRPRSGFPFRFHNILVLGLPLIQSLSSQQLKLVIHRELLHITQISRHYTGWFYYLRNLWYQFLYLHQKNWSINNLIIRAFFSWYAPLYKLLSQAAARQEQLYVDKQLSHQHQQNELLNSILVMGISENFLYDKHIPHLLNEAYKHEFPPYFPYESFERSLQLQIDYDFSQHCLDKALSRQALNRDFPSLQQRLRYLGINSIHLADINKNNSASNLLGEALPLLCQQMDDNWFKENEMEWNKRFKIGQGEQNKLKEYQILLKQDILSEQKTWEYILLIKKYLDENSSMNLYKQILKSHYTNPEISFDIGRTLLKNLDAEGITAMQKAIDQDAAYTLVACQLLTRYYSRTGNKKMAQNYRRRALEYQLEAA